MIETSGTMEGMGVIETETWRGWAVIETSGTRRRGGDGQ